MNTQQVAKTDSNQTPAQAKQQRFIKPRYEVLTEKDRYIVRIFAPGASKDSVNVTHEKDSLSITAHRTQHYRDGWKPLGREIVEADYRLQLQLNVAIDESGIEAKLDNGVLDVTLPVAEEAKPRKIDIS